MDFRVRSAALLVLENETGGVTFPYLLTMGDGCPFRPLPYKNPWAQLLPYGGRFTAKGLHLYKYYISLADKSQLLSFCQRQQNDKIINVFI